MIQQRFEITHFEEVSRLITYKIPDFFNKKNPDFNRISKELRYVSPNEKNKKKLENHLSILKMVEKAIRADVAKFHEVKGEDLNKLSNQKIHNLVYMLGGLNDMSPVETRFLTRMIEQVYGLNVAGKKIFRVEEQLMNELLLTDCSKVDASFLKLPFQTICIHLPFNNYLKLYEKSIKWIYVSEKKVSDIPELEEWAIDDKDYAGRFLDIFCMSEDDTYTSCSFLFRDGEDISDQIKEIIDTRFAGSKQGKKENIELFSFITSLMLYINSAECDAVQVMPKVMFPAKDSRLPMCSLGRSIRIDRELTASLGEAGTERTIHALKWTVRGHWRNQVHGAERKERRKQWIRPFLKGKERDGDISPKPTMYDVK